MTFPSIESVATGTEENCILNFRGAAAFSGSAGGAGAAATAVGNGAGTGVGTAGTACAVKKAVHVPGKAAAVSELHCAYRNLVRGSGQQGCFPGSRLWQPRIFRSVGGP